MILDRVSQLFERYGVIVAFVGLLVWNGVFAENADVFRSPENLRNILNQNAATGIVAIGMTLVIVGGGIDLAVGSVMALAAAIGLLASNAFLGFSESYVESGTLSAGAAEWLAVGIGFAAGIGTGLAAGALNGVLVTVGRLPAFIATLGGLVGYRSISLALAEAGEIRATKTAVLTEIGRGGLPVVPGSLLASGNPLIFSWSIITFLVLAVVGQIVLSRTRYGRHLVAVGGNPTAARYSAIAVDWVRFVSYVLIGLCAALAGLLQMARMSSVSTSQLGSQMELDAIAAVVIGGTAMSGGRGRVWGTVLGVLILGIINNMLIVSQVSTYWQGALKGAIIVVAVLIQRGRKT
ncbi:MAG: ABC transporter permease [Phycisphaerae bacterium]|nr:ABC transporter permease [Phycisphaerae bacterium]